MNSFLHTSATQIDTFADGNAEPFVGGEGCNRAWWFEKILSLPKPTSASAARGQAIHKKIEDYLTKGEKLTPDLEQHVLRFLPARKDVESKRVRVEHPIELLVGQTSIKLKGYVDIWSKGRIEDHKTSADTRWFKTGPELKKNTQLLLYGYAQHAAFFQDGKGELLFAHNQLLVPKGSVTVTYATRTEATVPVTDTIEFWKKRAIPITERMKEVALLDDPSKVTPNWNACGRFGGCAFADRCAALKGAGATTPSANPFASRPTSQENNMPGPTVPLPRLSPQLAAAVGKVQHQVVQPQVVSAGVQTRTQPVAPSTQPASQVKGATGVTPPDAPPDSKPGMPAAPTTPETKPAPTQSEKSMAPINYDILSDKQKSDVLLSRGFSGEDISLMDTDAFEAILRSGHTRDEIEYTMGKDDQGPYIAGFECKKPVEPPAPLPRRRVTTQIPIAGQPDLVVKMTQEITGTPLETKPVGRAIGCPKVAETARQPRNAENRLGELGFKPEQVAKMSRNTMQILLDEKIHAKFVTVLNDGSAMVFDQEPNTAPVITQTRPVEPEKMWYWNPDASPAFVLLDKLQAADVVKHGHHFIGTDAEKEEFEQALVAAEKGHTNTSEVYARVVMSVMMSASRQERDEAAGFVEPEPVTNGHYVGGESTLPEGGEDFEQQGDEQGSVSDSSAFEAKLRSMGEDEFEYALDRAILVVHEAKSRGVLAPKSDDLFQRHIAEAVQAAVAEKDAEIARLLEERNAARRQVAELDGAAMRAEAAAGVSGLTLYIDCAPQKGEPVIYFDDFIAPHHDAVAKANGVEHIDDHDKLFGRGPGMIASRLLLAANRPTGALVVYSDHRFAPACLEVLTRFATKIVRGRR